MASDCDDSSANCGVEVGVGVAVGVEVGVAVGVGVGCVIVDASETSPEVDSDTWSISSFFGSWEDSLDEHSCDDPSSNLMAESELSVR